MTREVSVNLNREPVVLTEETWAEVREMTERLQQSQDETDQIKFHILNAFLQNGNKPLTLHELFTIIPWRLEDKTLREINERSLYTNLESIISRIKNLMSKGQVHLASANDRERRGQSEQLYVLKERAESGQQESLVA